MLWKFILVNSNDLSHIGELSQASGKKLEIVLGKPGSFSFSYPMTAEYAADIRAFKTGIKALRWNRRASEAAGEAVWDCQWSGYVLPIDENCTDNKMSISCVGWWQRLARRFVRREKLYRAVDDGDIVQDLLAEVNMSPAPDGYVVKTPTGSNPATPTWMTWGGKQPDEGPGGATPYRAAAGRNKSVAKYSYVQAAIDELMAIEDGGDFVVDPLTRAVTWHRRYRRVRDDVVLGFQWGPQNVRQFSRNLEADSQINYIVASGAVGTTPQYADDQSQQDEIGLLEESVVLPDVRDNDVLLTFAGAEQIVRGNGLVTYTVQPFPLAYDAPSNVPEAFIDYRIGDQVRLTAVHDPRVNVRGQAVRIFGISIDIDDNGVATLGPLQVAP